MNVILMGKMDSIELIAREEEFKKLNRQLQKKTESLMKEIEYVMQKPDPISEFTTNLYSNRIKKNYVVQNNFSSSSTATNQISSKRRPQTVSKCEKNSKLPINGQANNNDFESATNSANCAKIVQCLCCPNEKISGEREFLYAFVALNVKDEILPQSFMKNTFSVESVCKCLLSKIKLLQEQIDKLKTDIDKKATQCESHMTQLAGMESERMSLVNRTNNMKSATADMKAKCGSLQAKLEEKDRVYKELRSEADRYTTELKRLRSRNTTLEARCASQEETIESLKQQLDTAKRVEKELRESSRTLSAAHETALSRLGARQRGLEACVRTQGSLVDNLRRQLAVVTTEGALQYLHDEYAKLLSRDF